MVARPVLNILSAPLHRRDAETPRNPNIRFLHFLAFLAPLREKPPHPKQPTSAAARSTETAPDLLSSSFSLRLRVPAVNPKLTPTRPPEPPSPPGNERS